MTDTVRTDIGPFEVAEFRKAMAEAELEDIIDELVEAFLEDAPARMSAIETAVAVTAAEEIRYAAHAYKSSAASMGAKQLADLLRQLELAGSEGDSARAAALLPEVLDAHESVVVQLTEHFG
jgi:HPt (histidine-containing phosphotransfer) domain-containing protein